MNKQESSTTPPHAPRYLIPYTHHTHPLTRSRVCGVDVTRLTIISTVGTQCMWVVQIPPFYCLVSHCTDTHLYIFSLTLYSLYLYIFSVTPVSGRGWWTSRPCEDETNKIPRVQNKSTIRGLWSHQTVSPMYVCRSVSVVQNFPTEYIMTKSGREGKKLFVIMDKSRGRRTFEQIIEVFWGELCVGWITSGPHQSYVPPGKGHLRSYLQTSPRRNLLRVVRQQTSPLFLFIFLSSRSHHWSNDPIVTHTSLPPVTHICPVVLGSITYESLTRTTWLENPLFGLYIFSCFVDRTVTTRAVGFNSRHLSVTSYRLTVFLLVLVPVCAIVELYSKCVCSIVFILEHWEQVAIPWTHRISSECLEDNEPENKRVHFRRQFVVFTLRHHVHLCVHDVLCMHMCGCDSWVVVFEDLATRWYSSRHGEWHTPPNASRPDPSNYHPGVILPMVLRKL